MKALPLLQIFAIEVTQQATSASLRFQAAAMDNQFGDAPDNMRTSSLSGGNFWLLKQLLDFRSLGDLQCSLAIQALYQTLMVM